MKYGFLKTAAATPDLKVADPEYNRTQICNAIEEGKRRHVKLMVFPELALTSYTCQDLFLQSALLRSAKAELKEILRLTRDTDMLVAVGLPWEEEGKLYNVAAVIQRGSLLGLVPKAHIPNYGECYEARYFQAGNSRPVMVSWEGQKVPMGMNLLFSCDNVPGLIVAVEICEDLWAPASPGVSHAQAGATVLVNCSASPEAVGKAETRRQLVKSQSSRLVCGYIYANAGIGESTQDLVFGGQDLICENGKILAESERFSNGIITAELDLERLTGERRRMNTFLSLEKEEYMTLSFTLEQEEVELERHIAPLPFVPEKESDRKKRCEEILSIQAYGLRKRLEHTNCTQAVLGISGGLDSTLALLVTARAFDLAGIPRSQIHAVTMPCFGTTDRTYENACRMTKQLGASLREVDIKEAVSLHFRDIGHEESCHDVTYENAQARERTQVLMDIANQVGGMVIGTGDMSELALGWATYNGDHMSMYGVNASVPKTLVRHLVYEYAMTCGQQDLKEVLLDVLDTPVSPELLPPKKGQIAQKTEDLVGPYELHDFYLYYVLRFGFSPSKIYHMAVYAFYGRFGSEEILKWLKVFYRRFFSQQFKRSCLPDGPKVGSVGVSPRGDLRMPSDGCSHIWLKVLEEL